MIPEDELQQARLELQAARTELEELQQQIQTFEAQVEAVLGKLLDQLSAIRSEITSLNETVKQIREQRMFGEDRIRYLGATLQQSSPTSWDEPPLIGKLHSQADSTPFEVSPPPQKSRLPDRKLLYRQLALRYHPDLARNEAERREYTEMMIEINQIYLENDLAKLMDLAGMEVPFYLRLSPEQKIHPSEQSLSELERVQLEVNEVRRQITRLGSLPSVQLSMEVKLARIQGRDLLAEMANDLKCRLERKLAERDYLRAQIQASQVYSEDG